VLAWERDRRRFQLEDDGRLAVRHPIGRMYGLWGYRAVLIGEPWMEEESGLDDVHSGLYIKYARLSVW
jgi:hypothetical protein